MRSESQPLTPARDLLDFIHAAPTPYHAVAEIEARLQRAGFRRFEEGETWSIEAGCRGFAIRDGSVIAFVAGTSPASRAGFRIIGAHTDSPNLRLKPRPTLESVGFRQLAVEVYGGVLLGTWLDRDLGLGGRVALADGQQVRIRLDSPICRIPNLAIHLNRDVNKEGLALNPQLHLSPVLGLEKAGASSALDLLARSCGDAGVPGVRAPDIVAFDLCLFDLQPGTIGGDGGEFLFSARLDNLASCHAACEALLSASGDSEATRVIALYDHEEVGSQSATGARSQFLESVLERLASSGDSSRDASVRAFSQSLLISADMAHGVHPNYADKHDRQHRPQLGGGPVLKVNSNQSYATDGPGAAAFVRACRAVDVEPQHFVARNDMPCGSTIGPITAARLGIRTVDVGNPMLSMHSCREMAATADVEPMIRVLTRLLSASA
ncbi:MAG TPA: M18 family aminopeptidase [Polyangiaceae bacterium]|nr:M18 family aminopeptidase [Polyangiaceae bacterium]